MAGSWKMDQNTVTKTRIDSFLWSIFQKHDRDRSGYLDFTEFYPAFTDLFLSLNYPAPPYNYCVYYLNYFDTDGNRQIDFNEFRKLAYAICGYN